jgi:hypothetical protein
MPNIGRSLRAASETMAPSAASTSYPSDAIHALAIVGVHGRTILLAQSIAQDRPATAIQAGWDIRASVSPVS